ncbi:MAG: GNAT family N-acetyltransferase [Pseudomonadota bacterium]
MHDLLASPLTRARWNDLVEIFGGGDGRGECGRCWCQWWRMTRPDFAAADQPTKKAAMEARVAIGPAPGLLGYCGTTPVGWVQVGPRADVAEWNAAGRLTAPLDAAERADPTIWGVTCFVIRAGHRRRGHAGRLLDAAIQHARAAGAVALDACPVEPTRPRPASALYHGLASQFAARGFVEIARRRPDRPLMRLMLR